MRLRLLLLLSLLPAYTYANKLDSLLTRLDYIVKNRNLYVHRKEMRMDSIKRIIPYSEGKKKYMLYGKLFDEYRSFDTDSAQQYAVRKMVLAKELNNKDYLNDSRMNQAEVYYTVGSYIESMNLLSEIKSNDVADYLKPYYYHLYRTMYELMGDYSLVKDDKKKYVKLKSQYNDSLINIADKKDYVYILMKSNKEAYAGKIDESIYSLRSYIGHNKLDASSYCPIYFTLGDLYNKKGDRENAKIFYAQSAILDLHNSTREYLALQKLAYLLYEDGQIERAYRYIRCSIEDASLCNARLRTIEASSIFPIVDKAYQKLKDKHEEEQEIAIIVISILAICLLIAIFVLFRQLKNNILSKKIIERKSASVEKLNKELKEKNILQADINQELENINTTLKESNTIKEEYIGHYMDMCTFYLEKLKSYNSMLKRKASSGKVQDIYAIIKDDSLIENELKSFYEHFDETFLKLFPTFIDELNKMLVEDGRIYPKSSTQLTTELRVFALIRLGINESSQIAAFLHCSITTVYNYRVKIRNRAIGNRDDLEQKIMSISSICK